MNQSAQFKAWRVETRETEEGTAFTGAIALRRVEDLPAGDVLIRVRYSSLNYKDALSAAGNRGVTKHYPHTPGIDAVGEVLASSTERLQPGDQVVVTGYDLGMNTDGGFAQQIRVPGDWPVLLPEGLTAFEAMVLGTAGLTAALCVRKLLRNGLTPEAGAVLVTGASGGVGTLATALLSQLGYTVEACSGKPEAEPLLRALGASRVLSRAELEADSDRPLLKERWAAAIDVLGGKTLASVLKAIHYGGSVACCGLVASPELPTSVFPFILRGVNLLGVDSVNVPLPEKQALWQALAGEWKLAGLSLLGREIGFDQLPQALAALLAGQGVGRTVLNPG